MGKVISDEIGLEKRAHLGIAWSGMVQDQKMDFERCHEDEYRDNDEANDPCTPVSDLVALCEWKIKLLKRKEGEKVVLTTGILKSPNLSQRSSMV